MKAAASALAVILAFIISSSAWAFTPANGLWGIDSEMTGDPGRGFTVEVQNGVLSFTYYGYRADGTSLFYVASGPMSGNTFTSDLLNVQGGTPLGASWRAGAVTVSPGKLTLNFTSGLHGTITLPGEGPKAISKYSFGYADGPNGLLGTWLLTMIIEDSPYVELVTLDTKIDASSTGNGVVTSSTGGYACEFQTSGVMAGMVVCVNPQQLADSDRYYFKFSGDRGDGVDLYGANFNPYEAHALRIFTGTGLNTGLNDGSVASSQAYGANRNNMSAARATVDFATSQAKNSASANSATKPFDTKKIAAIAAWASETSAMLSKSR